MASCGCSSGELLSLFLLRYFCCVVVVLGNLLIGPVVWDTMFELARLVLLATLLVAIKFEPSPVLYPIKFQGGSAYAFMTDPTCSKASIV